MVSMVILLRIALACQVAEHAKDSWIQVNGIEGCETTHLFREHAALATGVTALLSAHSGGTIPAGLSWLHRMSAPAQHAHFQGWCTRQILLLTDALKLMPELITMANF